MTFSKQLNKSMVAKSRQRIACKYCMAVIDVRPRKAGAQEVVFSEHRDKTQCARVITLELHKIAQERQRLDKVEAGLRAAMPEVEKLALLAHPGLAQTAPAGMHHTPSGLVVPK
jgi:predicted negative regulator of RcsB-dependent stress response